MQINFGKREVSCKLVFYGPGLSGKTTNLEVVHQKTPDDHKGALTSIATEGDRTLFFDFLPLELGKVRGMNTKFQLYTVPGQIYYNSTRKLVLQGADGVIFVADSQDNKMEENIESLKNLDENLKEYNSSLEELPVVLQYNKRDMPNAMPVEEMDKQLNWIGAPTTEAVAYTGEGVFQTLKLAASLVLDKINSQGAQPGGGAAPAPKKPEAPFQPAAPKEVEYIAKVNGDSLKKSDFQSYCLIQYRLNVKGDPDPSKKFEKKELETYLDSLINHVLLLHESRKKQIKVTKDEIEAQMNLLTNRFGSTDGLQQYLKKRKLSIDNLKNEASRHVLTTKLLKLVMPDFPKRLVIDKGEAEEFYKKHSDEIKKPFEEVETWVTNRIKQDKKKKLLNEFFDEIRKQNTIEKNMSAL